MVSSPVCSSLDLFAVANASETHLWTLSKAFSHLRTKTGSVPLSFSFFVETDADSDWLLSMAEVEASYSQLPLIRISVSQYLERSVLVEELHSYESEPNLQLDSSYAVSRRLSHARF